eukprot:scaffold437_cov288-Chaetoceros_neogracile.AAC.37
MQKVTNRRNGIIIVNQQWLRRIPLLLLYTCISATFLAPESLAFTFPNHLRLTNHLHSNAIGNANANGIATTAVHGNSNANVNGNSNTYANMRSIQNNKRMFTSSLRGSDTDTDSGVDSTNNLEETGTETETDLAQKFSAFAEMALPYYKESSAGRWLFAGMIAMTLLNSGVSVAFSYLGKDFWNALSNKDVDQFYFMLQKYAAALLVGSPVSVLYTFQRERLA